MSTLRFTGTLKEIEYSLASNKKLRFLPDSECAVIGKEGKDETNFVVLLPVDDKARVSDKDTGIVFTYDKEVCICLEASNVEWLPTWKVNGHYKIVMKPNETKKKSGKEAGRNSKTSEDSNDVVITVEGIGHSKQFQLVFVSEKE